MLKAARVSIVNEDSFAAGEEVASELKEELQGTPELILLFNSCGYEHEKVLKGIYSKLPKLSLAGCSSYAEINSEEALTNSVTAMGLLCDEQGRCNTDERAQRKSHRNSLPLPARGPAHRHRGILHGRPDCRRPH